MLDMPIVPQRQVRQVEQWVLGIAAKTSQDGVTWCHGDGEASEVVVATSGAPST